MTRKETLRKRLKKRLDSRSWNYYQIDRCLEGLQDPVFREHVDTDALSLYEVVSFIGQSLDLSMNQEKPNGLFRFYRRLRVTLKHIRW